MLHLAPHDFLGRLRLSVGAHLGHIMRRVMGVLLLRRIRMLALRRSLIVLELVLSSMILLLLLRGVLLRRVLLWRELLLILVSILRIMALVGLGDRWRVDLPVASDCRTGGAAAVAVRDTRVRCSRAQEILAALGAYFADAARRSARVLRDQRVGENRGRGRQSASLVGQRRSHHAGLKALGRILARGILAGRILTGRILAGRILAGGILAGRVLAWRVLAGRVLAVRHRGVLGHRRLLGWVLRRGNGLRSSCLLLLLATPKADGKDYDENHQDTRSGTDTSFGGRRQPATAPGGISDGVAHSPDDIDNGRGWLGHGLGILFESESRSGNAADGAPARGEPTHCARKGPKTTVQS